MKLYRAQGIVLGSREMRDAHRLLTLFCLEHGKIKAVAHGVAKPTSRKRGAVQLFCYSNFLLRRGRQLDSIAECEGKQIFPGLWADLDRLSWAGYVAELIDGLTTEGEPLPAVFNLLLQTLQALEKTTELELLLRAFELKLLTILGYQPHLSSCVGCGAGFAQNAINFSAEDGGLICSNCSGKQGLVCSGEAVAVMKLLLRWDLFKIGRLSVSPRARTEIKKILQDYLQWHLERRIKTLRFISQIQSGVAKA